MKYKNIKKEDKKVWEILKGEEKRQKNGLELVPSENYISSAVKEALASDFSNKYAEGRPGRRYYGGQEFTDKIEILAQERAKKLFKAKYVNVQPLSGAPANLAVYNALLKPGDKILGMDLSHGGHLTHGHPVTLSAQIYDFVGYKTEASGEIDYDALEKMARREKPKLMLAGSSAYSRKINYRRFTQIAKKVGAISMIDIAHIAGLIAGKALVNPVPYFDIVTTTTHKTLRGPRGGMIMCKKQYAKAIDKSAFPGFQGGPHMNNISAKAVAFGEALRPSFQKYSKQILKNAKVLEKELKKYGFKIVFGKTENHMVLVDVFGCKNITGKEFEIALDKVGITLNKNVIPDDPRSPFDPSGVRIGVPAITTRGMKEKDIIRIAAWINEVAENIKDEKFLKKTRQEVRRFCQKFPLHK